MPTQAELITIFRKENEDLTISKVEEMFLAKHVEVAAIVGNNSVVFTGDAYDDTSYLINIYSAVDINGIDVKGELEILDGNKTVNGFVINCITACTIKLTTMRKLPKISYWT